MSSIPIFPLLTPPAVCTLFFSLSLSGTTAHSLRGGTLSDVALHWVLSSAFLGFLWLGLAAGGGLWGPARLIEGCQELISGGKITKKNPYYKKKFVYSDFLIGVWGENQRVTV